MKSTVRRIFTATTGISLIAFAIISACTAGVVAPPGTLAFGLLVVLGLLEMTIASFSPRWLAPAPRTNPGSSAIVTVPALEFYEHAV